ncbi:transmembrane protein [Jingmen Miniopterus schreibersii paramyxovirus 1]|uniref:Transmembrane protein n=1 Tax=Jingmen Miniopterus schreibersii paramyxovirus 1 TaxID=2877500 RepID=A0AAE8XSB1_9MONO|nr:transmembrane protein [Jingmen Miniopterus schreibersii paramyxovirus 1]
MDYYKGNEDGDYFSKPKKQKSCNVFLFIFNVFYHIGLMTAIIMMLYFSIESADNVRSINNTYKDLYHNVREIHDYMLYDLKPRTVIIDRVLSYQLPTAIVKAFEISHTDLRETLEGVVVDLAKLTEVYRALLGFNSDWGLEENAQRLKCSWEAKTMKEEAEEGSAELQDHLLRVNTSIEQVKSMYGDFDGVRLEIENLFGKIRQFINDNLQTGSNSTLIQLDSLTINASLILNNSINEIKKSVVSNFAKLVSSNFKLRNRLIDMNVQAGLNSYTTDWDPKHRLNREVIKNINPRIHEVVSDSDKLFKQLQQDNQFLVKYHKRLSKLVDFSVKNNIMLKYKKEDIRPTPLTGKDSKATKNRIRGKSRRSSSEEIVKLSDLTPFHPTRKITFNDLKKIYTSREQALNVETLNKRHRYNPLNILTFKNRSEIDKHYKELTKEFWEFNNGSDLGLFYSLVNTERFKTIKGAANKKISRTRRFTFIPHLTAYELPLSRMSAKLKTTPTRVTIEQTNENRDQILKKLALKTRQILKQGHYWDSELDPLGYCYIGKIPGYKLVHCPNSPT